ncbi:MAG: diacylglycerol kinase [Candidatus Thermoplasmatota archaeon]
MPNKPEKNVKKNIIYAVNGIKHAISKEISIKLQLITSIIIIITSILLKVSTIELIIIILLSFFVIILEMINTSIERLIDKKHQDYDTDIGLIKDMLAGMVLLGLIASLLIEAIILLPRLLKII